MKKTVNFVGEPYFFDWWFEQVPPKVEKYAVNGNVTLAKVYALDHPRLGRGVVRTSVVTKRYKNGNFNTLNTKYKKVVDKKD